MFRIFLGWDGLGLISFALVIYFQNYKSYYSGMLTALTNRIGDVFVLGRISLFFRIGGFNYINFLYNNSLFCVSLFFFIASLTKRAQIPFSSWLPAAIAAPTPVSSLVHSSTLVTAGVYIIIRFNYFLTDFICTLIIFLGLLTIFIAGMCGLYEYDLKKIIAFSTLSQLGFIIATISVGLSDLAFFHLIVHASFKALIFICAGVFIHNFFNNQDIRRFGFLNKSYCFSLCIFNFANFSLCGFPFLSGFFSKDLILELVLIENINFFIFFLFILGSFLTVFYTFRIIINLTFKNSFYFSISIRENNLGICNSIWGLFLFSISFGYFGSYLILFPINFIVLPSFLKFFILFLCIISFLISFFFSFYFKKKEFRVFFFFFINIWFINFLKTDFFKSFFYLLSYFLDKASLILAENILGQNFVGYSFHFSKITNSYIKKMFFISFPFFFFWFFYSFLIF